MIKISKTNLKATDKRKLYFDNGGLCSICCERLDYDKFSRERTNVSEYAHIIGDSEQGPRGDKNLSELYAGDIKNIIILCPRCHEQVDKNESFYTIDRLQKIKSSHIERVRNHLDSLKNEEAFSVKYEAPIGGAVVKVDEQRMDSAIANSGFISHEIPISLNPNNTTYPDNTEKFWETERDQLYQNFQKEIEARLKRGDVKPFLLFAIAPQPLLIQLGVLMNDKHDVKVFQKRREPDTWEWNENPVEQSYQIKIPEKIFDTVAVKLSLSDRITDDRIIEVLGHKTSIWEITHENPHNDFICHPMQLSELRKVYRKFYQDIRKTHGQKTKIHVFPASPVSAAIEFGRVWMPKADATLIIYNHDSINNRFELAFTIGA